MAKVKIYHNPRCSKSRATLALIQDKGIEPEIVEYLQTPPSAGEVSELIDLLGIEPHHLLRTKESEYKKAGLSKDSTRKQIATAIAQYPRLLERPVVVVGKKAVIGRPPENVLDLL